jgi:hypothetical protein
LFALHLPLSLVAGTLASTEVAALVICSAKAQKVELR